jgi:hypothetical protein
MNSQQSMTQQEQYYNKVMTWLNSSDTLPLRDLYFATLDLHHSKIFNILNDKDLKVSHKIHDKIVMKIKENRDLTSLSVINDLTKYDMEYHLKEKIKKVKGPINLDKLYDESLLEIVGFLDDCQITENEQIKILFAFFSLVHEYKNCIDETGEDYFKEMLESLYELYFSKNQASLLNIVEIYKIATQKGMPDEMFIEVFSKETFDQVNKIIKLDPLNYQINQNISSVNHLKRTLDTVDVEQLQKKQVV